MKPTLFVLAAGMGSRYGGLKQLDGLGPNGETIMDFSIYDAIRAGFGKLVFVIRKSFEKDFREKILSKYENHIPVELVFQDLNDLPEGFTCPADRTKPWGTNHAVLMGKDVIDSPFAVINADDFYGRDSFEVITKELSGLLYGVHDDYCMVGYKVGNTLSESGSVARGVCETNAEGYLTGVVERTSIERIDGKIQFTDENGQQVVLDDDVPVSMNMWGFTPDYFQHSEEYFKEFLKENINKPKAEFFIPLMVNKLITEGTSRVKVLHTSARWFGVTYAADRQGVVDKFKALMDAGEYPSKLFQ
jgi:choline kinase